MSCSHMHKRAALSPTAWTSKWVKSVTMQKLTEAPVQPMCPQSELKVVQPRVGQLL